MIVNSSHVKALKALIYQHIPIQESHRALCLCTLAVQLHWTGLQAGQHIVNAVNKLTFGTTNRERESTVQYIAHF